MSRVMISEYWDRGLKKPIRTYYLHDSIIPPFTMSLGSKKYIMPGWYELDDNEKLPNIKDIKHIMPNIPIKDNIPNIDSYKVYKVLSSKGDKEYEVNTNISGSLECSCMGYGFRRRCRHIEEVKSLL
tara:strand:+ start:229 stop:609 length:381 start_codon:yes stop_codon:yes gene_type:complete